MSTGDKWFWGIIILGLGLPLLAPCIVGCIFFAGFLLVLIRGNYEPLVTPEPNPVLVEAPAFHPQTQAEWEATLPPTRRPRSGLDWTPEEWESGRTPKQPKANQGKVPGAAVFPKFNPPPKD